MKQIMTYMGKDSYKELKELSYNRKTWITAAKKNQTIEDTKKKKLLHNLYI